MAVANLLNHGAIGKAQILGCAGTILLGPKGGPPTFLTFFPIWRPEHADTSAAPAARL